VKTWWRLICRGPGVTSLIIPPNSAWAGVHTIADDRQRQPQMSCVVSLGQGNYSVEMQANIQTITSSIFSIADIDQVNVVVTEIRS
jgi:hypothetical protein